MLLKHKECSILYDIDVYITDIYVDIKVLVRLLYKCMMQ